LIVAWLLASIPALLAKVSLADLIPVLVALGIPATVVIAYFFQRLVRVPLTNWAGEQRIRARAEAAPAIAELTKDLAQEEKAAKDLLRPGCEPDTYAAAYLGWEGTVHTFGFANRLYAETFRQMNDSKILD
jgi:hypothetical protein